VYVLTTDYVVNTTNGTVARDGGGAITTGQRLFKLEHARRLAAAQPDARVETIADSRAFSMLDQPGRLSELIVGVAQRSAAGQAIR
jgi:hypothetical protein